MAGATPMINGPTTLDRSRRADAIAFIAMLVIVTLAVGFRFIYDFWLSDYDRLTQFLPWFGYVGDRLREGQIPAWNPHDSSGAPFAGSPANGFMYFPVMVAFPLFDVINAYKLLVLMQSLLAGIAAYCFSRRIGMNPLAATAGSISFSIGPLLYGATMYATPTSQLLPFIPLALLAVEGAMRSHRISSRLGWSILAGVALLNIFTASPPRFIYGALIVAGWLAYRCIFVFDFDSNSRRIRLARAFMAGMVMALSATALGAIVLLPQLDFQAASNIAGSNYANLIGGDYVAFTWISVYSAADAYLDGRDPLLRPTFQSSAVVAIAVFAILMGKKNYGTPFFAVVTFISIDLCLRNSLTRDLFYLIPGFEQVNSHRPTATSAFVIWSVPMLVAAGIQLHMDSQSRWRTTLARALTVAAVLIICIASYRFGNNFGGAQFVVGSLALALLLLPELSRRERWKYFEQRFITVGVVGVLCIIVFYPTGLDVGRALHDSSPGPNWNEPIAKDESVSDIVAKSMKRSDPGTAAVVLQGLQSNVQPFRYAPFTGSADTSSDYVPAAARRADPVIVATLANGRATRLGLEQIPGYNAVHLAYYVDYINAMNGAPQDYHWLDVMTPAISGSPLLDMLNVRYVLIPVNLGYTPPIAYIGTEVYRDAEVIIYENPNAFPRAWIVHDVQPAQDGAELQLLNTGQVDGRVTAFVHGDLPPVSSPDPNGPADSVVVTSYEPETIELSARSTGDGLLVLSEVYANGWNAYVDGERVDVLRTNHALRGVPLVAGEHEVVLRYEPLPLRIGLWSTGLSSVAMIGVWIWAVIDWRRQRRLPNANPQES